MVNKKSVDSHSLSEALDILERAAQERSKDFVKELKPEFDRLKKIWGEVGPTISEVKESVIDSGKDAANSAVEAGKEALQHVNRKAKEEPWLLAGIVALFALVLGFILGKRSES